ncbi:hypothetical protein [Sphingobium herbicidovorans]
MGDAARWGGSSMAVGMAAIPQEAHQADRHMDRPRAVIEPHVGDGRADDGPARHARPICTSERGTA